MIAGEGNRGNETNSKSNVIKKEKENSAPKHGTIIIMKMKGRD